MGWIDDLAGAVAPRWALRREAARRALAELRAYDAAGRPKKWESWRRPPTGARTEIEQGGQRTRDAVRDLLRNNGYAQSAMRSLMRATVATGIVGTPELAGGRKASQRTRDAWERWVDGCDAEGHHDLYGLQALAVRTFYESGDALVRYRRQSFGAGELVAPVRVQVLEPDYIDTTKNSTTFGADGGWIDRGIQYDAQGRKVGLWLWPVHPGDLSRYLRTRVESSFVPMGEVEHVYEMLRPGQDRGISAFAGAVMPLKDLADYFEAEAMRKRVEACLSVFVSRAEPNDGIPALGVDAGRDEATGAPTTRLTPGLIHELPPGMNVTTLAPNGSPDIRPFAEQLLFLAAAAGGVMFEHMTGNFEKVNYSSYRVGSFDFAGAIEQRQWLTLMPRLCRPMARAFREAALAAELVSQDVRVRWTPPPAVTSPDPVKDATADVMRMRSGVMAPSEVAEARGWTWADVLERQRADYAMADEIFGGPALAGDPRRAAGAPSEGVDDARNA